MVYLFSVENDPTKFKWVSILCCFLFWKNNSELCLTLLSIVSHRGNTRDWVILSHTSILLLCFILVTFSLLIARKTVQILRHTYCDFWSGYQISEKSFNQERSERFAYSTIPKLEVSHTSFNHICLFVYLKCIVNFKSKNQISIKAEIQK